MKQTSFEMDGATFTQWKSDAPADATPIFDIDPTKQKYNFVGNLDGGEVFDLLCLGWIEDDKQHCKWRVRFEDSGKKVIGEAPTIDHAVQAIKDIADGLPLCAPPQFFHGRRARQFVKRLLQ